MKTTAIFKATGLVYLVGALTVMAVPAPEAAIEARQFVPIVQGIEGVLKYASETLAVQIEGAATNLDRLKYLCKNSKTLTSRLAQQGYNTTFITNSICAASKAPALKTDALIRNLTQEASTRIWIVQALGSTLGNAKLLCKYTSELSNPGWLTPVPQAMPSPLRVAFRWGLTGTLSSRRSVVLLDRFDRYVLPCWSHAALQHDDVYVLR